MRTPVRLGAILVAVVVSVAPAVAGAGPALAATGTVHSHASTAHPFSDPVWFPLASKAVMNCMENNPGCPPGQVQNYWSWDLNGRHEPAGVFHQKVYAMGAGIVHVLAKNQGCGGTDENRGNTIYIDHGAGVISMYSHLAPTLLVKDGDYVSARTPIGYIGDSGYTQCLEKPKVRFLAIVVMHHAKPTKNGGIAGDYVQVKHTYACVNGQQVSWPQDLKGNDGTWTRWYHVPLGTRIPNTSDQRACIGTPPATAPQPHSAALKKASATSLKGSWNPAGGKYHVGTVLAQLQQYHPSIHQWLDLTSHELRGGAGSTHFTDLTHNGKYRMKVWFKNSVGWSRPTGWVDRVLS